MILHSEALAALDELRRGLALMTSPNPRGGTTSLIEVYGAVLLGIEAHIKHHERGVYLAMCEPASVVVTEDGTVTHFPDGGVAVRLNTGTLDLGVEDVP